MRRVTMNAFLPTALCLFVCGLVYAGGLTPPAGPLLPTMKTLDEVEPRIAVNATNTPGNVNSLFRITQPGSYYLTGNITGVAGKNGIEIFTNGVTLDLMGFDLMGVPGSIRGVTAPTFSPGVQIQNGSVRQWGTDGVWVSNPSSIVRDIIASDNGGFGVTVSTSCVVERCTAESNLFGLGIGFGSTAVNCTAFKNTNIGIAAGQSSVIRGCTASFNLTDGFRAESGALVTGCTAKFNDGDGIVAQSYSVLIGNICSSNGDGPANGAGIHIIGENTRVEGNYVSLNDRGIDVDQAGSLIIGNSASRNATNYDIAANNVYGPIIDRTIPGSAAVLGNSALGAVGTSNAWANFAQ